MTTRSRTDDYDDANCAPLKRATGASATAAATPPPPLAVSPTPTFDRAHIQIWAYHALADRAIVPFANPANPKHIKRYQSTSRSLSRIIVAIASNPKLGMPQPTSDTCLRMCASVLLAGNPPLGVTFSSMDWAFVTFAMMHYLWPIAASVKSSDLATSFDDLEEARISRMDAVPVPVDQYQLGKCERIVVCVYFLFFEPHRLCRGHLPKFCSPKSRRCD